jgi:hypothetical protein
MILAPLAAAWLSWRLLLVARLSWESTGYAELGIPAVVCGWVYSVTT